MAEGEGRSETMSDVATSYRREANAAARWIVDQVRSRLREHMATYEIDTLEFNLIKWMVEIGPASAACDVPKFTISGEDIEIVFSDEIGESAVKVLRTIAYVVVEPGRVTGKVVGSRCVEVYRRENL
jgi:hypothetical protein